MDVGKGKQRRTYKICAIYDTETCNFGEGAESRAYVVCYQVNDLRAERLDRYSAGKSDHIHIYRSEHEMIDFLTELIAWGEHYQKVPVVCAYNLMFDMKSLLYDLRAIYPMQVNAQNSTSVYTLDLMSSDGANVLLRFWDTFYLDMRGLKAMGEVAGLPKATGDWDYSLMRTPETELTEEERFYAERDVQVIPAYLRYLLDANDWLTAEMFGCQVLTKTSLVRKMAQNSFQNLQVPGSSKRTTVMSTFLQTCLRELPKDYQQYALRKACFYGGLTFTAAAYACTVQRNVMSLDVTSMHHTFMASKVPIRFMRCRGAVLQRMAERIVSTTREQVLANYCRPFFCGLHVKVSFTNIRVKPGTCFDTWGIATLARGKFQFTTDDYDRWQRNDSAIEQEEATRKAGYKNSAYKPTFAFGKLYSASEAIVFVNEIELWVTSRVYEWDSMQVLEGESTTAWEIAPDYVTLQSNMLFEMKSAMKDVVKHYREGEPYTREISRLIPPGIAKVLKDGTATEQFIESYYTSTVKGMFNGIYGTQAQDVFKPGYLVETDGSVSVNQDEVTKPDNYDERKPDKPKVFYDYGMRIVGRSRMHLVVAMELLFEALGSRIRVTGGDTDSIKASVDEDVTDAQVMAALQLLHEAATDNINRGYMRIRRNYPDLASDMRNVGCFEIEQCGNAKRYPYHIELWNKCRMSIDTDNHPHVTCAGLSRPEGAYTINDYMQTLIDERGAEYALTHSLGYNVLVANSVSHAMERTNPENNAVFDSDVRDWRGNVSHVREHEVYALYDCGRMLGEMVKATSIENIAYLKAKYNREVDTTRRVIERV